jgi:ABC-type iron transport system FetAB permease component
MSIIVTGDDVALPVTLKKDGVTFAIASGANIQAALVSQDRSALLAGPVTCLNSAPGANWAQSLVVVQIPSAATGAVLAYGPALLEIQVNDGGKLTWFVSVEIVKGTIA